MQGDSNLRVNFNASLSNGLDKRTAGLFRGLAEVLASYSQDD